MLRKLNGEYTEYDNKDNAKIDSKIFVKFGISNLFWFGYCLVIKQVSTARGNWESRIPISSNNPLIATGNFKYYTKYLKTWGVHKITINLEDKIIYIDAEAKNVLNGKPYIYWIKKNK